LDRACRLAPGDQTVALALATTCLGHDASRAAALFGPIAATSNVREAWLGLAAARRRLGDAAGAAEALAAALQRHVPDPQFAAMADAIAREAGAPGWCGLSSEGTVVAYAGEGAVPATCRPPSRKERGGLIRVTAADGRHFIGSPIDAAAITATVGCVTATDGGLTGWAWHPGDPGADPVLTIQPSRGRERVQVIASDASVRTNSGVLGRPRGFTVPAARLTRFHGLLHVRGRDGKDLLGSPLDPRACVSAKAAPAIRRIRAGSHQRRPVAVVIAVHGGTDHTHACLDSVLASLTRSNRLIVIDDASPEPELTAALDSLARRRRITLLRHARSVGFAASVNAGMRAAPERDVVLLNSDTLVAPGWLGELRSVAYKAPDIGTVTPLSNDATIVSYPNRTGGNDVPGLAAARHLDALARRVNGGRAIDIPVGVGFCLYIRRACLDAVGPFRAELFAQGYGEENDFCLRARQLGWRHVAAPGAFVAHVGGQSFGEAARHLRTRNAQLLERLHPGYGALIETHAEEDPLAEARRCLDMARWRTARRRRRRTVMLVTHAEGGGVERQIATSVARHEANGERAIVLRPSRAGNGSRCVAVSDGAANGFPNLRFAMPGELHRLQRLLAHERPHAIELHHLVGHHPAVIDLITALGAPYELHVHDYAWLCARVALVGPNQRYCGEPAVAQCEACIAEAGNLIDEDITVAALRRRSAKLLAGARRVIAPSDDAAARIHRHFPAVRPAVQPHEDDAAITDASPLIAPGVRRVCVVGAIGIHKGYQVVLDCARNAAARRLPLEFVVVGHTIDDRQLLATGRVFITGPYAAHEAVTLIKAQNATLAFLPSIWPETWCFSLGEAWRAGLRVVAFDIGAQAERIRRTGRGLVLPLGLQAEAINNALIAARSLSHT
jgi:GT2 family glycosyltransferase/glycosyltransferase involved in cell wall biosynthesis